MARGKQRSFEERIQEINEQIQTLEEKRVKINSRIAELKEQKTALENEAQAAKLAELAKVMEQTGKTPEEIIALLQKA